jgi:cholesterol transport system auxiliary component
MTKAREVRSFFSRRAVAPKAQEGIHAAMNTPRRNFLFLGGAALALAGCGDLLGPPPAPPVYILEAPAPLQPMAKLPWSVSVMRPTAPNALDGQRIPLIQPDLTLDYYANATLPDAIPDLVQSALVAAFEKSGAPASVSRDADALHADYDLFVDIKDFEARYAVKDGVPEVLVTLTVRLATAHGRVVAGSTTVTQRAPATANSVAAATAALGQALGAASAAIVTWAATFPAPVTQVPPPR